MYDKITFQIPKPLQVTYNSQSTNHKQSLESVYNITRLRSTQIYMGFPLTTMHTNTFKGNDNTT